MTQGRKMRSEIMRGRKQIFTLWALSLRFTVLIDWCTAGCKETFQKKFWKSSCQEIQQGFAKSQNFDCYGELGVVGELGDVFWAKSCSRLCSRQCGEAGL